MLGEGLVAAEAAFRVGFESPSQFSREFRPMFGALPRQDVAAPRIEVQPATSSGFHLVVSVR
jgi:AraC-like DNA-binding protein